jgi:hypothetical protein
LPPSTSCAKMLGQKPFRWAKPACFDFSSCKICCTVHRGVALKNIKSSSVVRFWEGGKWHIRIASSSCCGKNFCNASFKCFCKQNRLTSQPPLLLEVFFLSFFPFLSLVT